MHDWLGHTEDVVPVKNEARLTRGRALPEPVQAALTAAGLTADRLNCASQRVPQAPPHNH